MVIEGDHICQRPGHLPRLGVVGLPVQIVPGSAEVGRLSVVDREASGRKGARKGSYLVLFLGNPHSSSARTACFPRAGSSLGSVPGFGGSSLTSYTS